MAVDSIWFERILALRASAYRKAAAGIQDEIDRHSLHFAAIVDEDVVGATRVTFRVHGHLECEQRYPSWILERYGSLLGAASRMCVSPTVATTQGLPVMLATRVWEVGISHGIRIDVTKARLEALAYYLRLGYLFLRGSFFHFDRTNVPCGLIAYPADPTHKGRFSNLFIGIDSPCDLTAPEIRDRFTSSYREVMQEFKEFEKQQKAFSPSQGSQ